MTQRFWVVVLLGLGGWAGAQDIVLTHGHMWTGDAAKPWVEAVAIHADKIVAVGSEAEVMKAAGKGARVIDLGGRMAMPGIDDAHEHIGGAPLGVAAHTKKPPMADPSIAEVADAVKDAATTAKPGEWIQVDVGPAVIRHPAEARVALEIVAADHPVIAEAWWGHGAVLTAAALKKVGLSDDATDPPGGHYVRNDAGQIVLLEEAAATIVERKLGGEPGAAAGIAPFQKYADGRLRQGVTSVQVMDTNAPLDVLTKTFVDAGTPLRIRVMRWPLQGEKVADGEDVLSPKVRVAGVKYVLDGTPIEELAWQEKDYADKPGWRGRQDYSPEFVRGVLKTALLGKNQLLMHIVGDATTDEVLDIMEQLAPAEQWRPLRVRFEHADGFTTPERLARAKKMGIVVAQPRPGRPWKALVDAGIPLAYGSDNGMAPWFMFSVMTDAHNPQAITRDQALSVLTRGSAFAEFQETRKGTLAPGMLADIAVLSQDVSTAPGPALPGTHSVLTMVGGVVAFQSPEFTAP